MKKLLSIFLSSILCVNACMGVCAFGEETPEQTVPVAEAEVQSDGEADGKLTPRAILDHDVTNEISVVGTLRQSRTPLYVPVVGKPFGTAVAMVAVDSPEMKRGAVSLRLENNYITGDLKKDEIAVISVWAKVDKGEGTMYPYIESADHGIICNMPEEKLTAEWKHFYLITKIIDDIDEIKVNIQVGYPGQITYFGNLEIFAYSGCTADEVGKHLMGDDYVSADKAEESEKVSLEELSASAASSAVFLNGEAVAYLGGEERIMSNATGLLAPFIADSKLYLPIRFVSELFGTTVSYSEADKSIILTNGYRNAVAYLDKDIWLLDGKRWRASNPIKEDAGNTYMACEILAELLGVCSVYDAADKSCFMSKNKNEFDFLSENNYAGLVYEKSVLTPDEAYTLEIVHEKIENTVGIPALIETTDAVPSYKYMSELDSKLTYTVSLNGQSIAETTTVDAPANTEITVNLAESIPALSIGEYKIELTIENGGNTYYDVLYFFADNRALRKPNESKLVYEGADGKLVYIPDFKGNTIPDYSGVGYKNGKEPIPDVPAVIEVKPSGGDDTANIQAAIDYVSSLPANNKGIRGAVQLSKGVFKVEGKFTINTSGVSLRGSGNDNPNVTDAIPTGDADSWAKAHENTDGTIILLTTKVIESRMMDVHGPGAPAKINGTEQEIIDSYVPTGEYTFRVKDASGFKVGDQIIIEQTGNLAWVHEIGMDQIPDRTTPDANAKNNPDSGVNQWGVQKWKFEREITAIDGNKITLDLPVAGAIDKKWGGAIVYKFSDDGRISNIGIENMRVVAAWTPNKNNVDETYHAGEFVEFRNVKDAWVRNVTTEHLFLYNISIHNSSKRITVQDMYDLVAVKEYYQGEGYESTGRTFQETLVYVGRYGVYVGGQQNLMNRLYGDNTRHLVEYMSLVAGPNVFYEGWHKDPFAQMGPHMGWAVAGLYDNTRGWLHIQNRLNMGSGHGWAGAWFTAWNTTEELAVQKPPTAQNYAVGHHDGIVSPGSHPQFDQGYRDLQDTVPAIESIYVAQTRDRYGEEGLKVLEKKTDYDYTIHEVPTDVYADNIKIGDNQLIGFDKQTFNYVYTLDYGAETTPVVSAECEKYDVEVAQAETIDGTAVITVTAGDYSQKYTVKFKPGLNPNVKLRVSDEPQPENPMESVLDGNLNTRWSANGDGQWIDFEFTNVEEFSSIAVAYYSGSVRAASFTVQVSNDGVNYSDVATYMTSGQTDDLEYYNISGFKGKFVRILGHGNTVNKWNSISEVKVFDASGNDIFSRK